MKNRFMCKVTLSAIVVGCIDFFVYTFLVLGKVFSLSLTEDSEMGSIFVDFSSWIRIQTSLMIGLALLGVWLVLIGIKSSRGNRIANRHFMVWGALRILIGGSLIVVNHLYLRFFAEAVLDAQVVGLAEAMVHLLWVFIWPVLFLRWSAAPPAGR